MPRPGPRPYECVRRAWHSDAHQPLRGTLTQEVFRIVTEFHSSETRSKKEWQEKLPIVVLRAEEILYSKARTEAEYSDFSTLKSRLEDAVNTMIRRTDDSSTSSKDGPYMEPCVEAALSLGCTPKMNPRGQRPSSSSRMSSSSSSKRGTSSPTPPIITREGGPTNQNAPVSYLSGIVSRNEMDKPWAPTKLMFGGETIHGFVPQATSSSPFFNLNNASTPNFKGSRNEFEILCSLQPQHNHQQQQQQFVYHNAPPALGMIFPPPIETPPPAISFPSMQPHFHRDDMMIMPRSFESNDHGKSARNLVPYGHFQGPVYPPSFSSPQALPPPPPLLRCSASVPDLSMRCQRQVEDGLELRLAPPKGNLDTGGLSWQSEGPIQQVGAERLPCLKRKSPLHEDKCSSFEVNSKRFRDYPY